MTCKLPIGAALEFSATVDEIADALHDQLPAEDRETITRGELQARAVELLTHPAAAAALLAQIDEPAADSAAEPHDHATPYLPVDRGGPPGQTGDHNDAPLTRHHHRAKTHAGFQVDQLALGAYRWITPHGLARLVTPAGTRPVGLLRQRDGTVVGETYAHGPPVRLELSAPGARRR